MRSQNFGIEIEMTAITRSAATKVLAAFFNVQTEHYGGAYDTYVVRDAQNRQWKIMRDSSIQRETASGRGAGDSYSVELVSPICQYEDIATIQEIIRKLREAGAKVNSSCGIHVHIDAATHTPKTLRNIVNIMASKEDLLYNALQIKVARERYCRKADTRFLDDVNRRRPQTMAELESLWYDGRDGRHMHYDHTRYHGLNLHSVFNKGTIEFRLFNSTLHAGAVKAYIQLCLAISHQAKIQRAASRNKTQSANEKYTFRTWLLRLGLIGAEFKSARHHLLKNLEGNIAWKDPSQAEAQKERLAKKRAEIEENSTDSLEDSTDESTQEETEIAEEEQTDVPAFSLSM